MQLFGDLDIFYFVRISRSNWIGHVNRMDRKRKALKAILVRALTKLYTIKLTDVQTLELHFSDKTCRNSDITQSLRMIKIY
jgi:hypothetical protein